MKDPAAQALGARGGKARAASMTPAARSTQALNAANKRHGKALPLTGEQTIAEIAKQTDTILLSFSCGKDALAAWLACRPHFKRIVPYYMYLVPNLEFVEDSLRYYEGWFGTRIYRLPHPGLYRMLNAFVFQAPENCDIIERAELPEFEYLDIQKELRGDLGLSEDCYVASGVRAVDSPMRMVALRRYGSINHNKRQFFPVWDWDKERLVKTLRAEGVALPVDYRIFGRSFDGIDHRFLAGIKEHFPRDYARILKWFPLADLELARRHYAEVANG